MATTGLLPGTRVLVSIRGGEQSAEVTELRDEYVRCRFEDGRQVWVPDFKVRPETPGASAAPGIARPMSDAPAAGAAVALPPSPFPPEPAPGPPPPGNQPMPASQVFASHSASEPPPVESGSFRPIPSRMESPSPIASSEDRPLEGYLIALIYLGVIPCGLTFLVALAYSIPYFIWKKTKPQRARQWNMHVWIAFGCSIALYVSVFMMAGVVGAIAERSTPKSLTSTDGVIEIAIPKGLKPMKDLNEIATVQMGNMFKEAYVVVITEPKIDFDPVPNVDGYCELIIQGINESVTRAESRPERSGFEVNGMAGAQFRVAGTVEGARAQYLVTCLEGQDHFHAVYAWSTASRFESNRPILEQATNSIREVASD